MKGFERIQYDSKIMGGKPTIRGMRITVGLVVGLVASGYSNSEIIRMYPYLQEEDISQALKYAAWRVEEHEEPLDLV